MTSEGFGEMFEGAGKFPLVSMGGGAQGITCADPGASVGQIQIKKWFGQIVKLYFNCKIRIRINLKCFNLLNTYIC